MIYMLMMNGMDKVSVSLRSIVHSYPNETSSVVLLNIKSCFRLLTEYRSFLSYGQKSLLLQ